MFPSLRPLWPALLLPGLLSTTSLQAENWPQFRGPNAAGVSGSTVPIPADFTPERHLRWRASIPPGHSSPIVFGDRVYLTAVAGDELLTIALDRLTGRELWRRAAPHEGLEPIHRTGSHAQSSPATDGEVVISFFGSSGLAAHDTDGRQLWFHRLGPFKNDFGAGSSPILDGDRVILVQDHDVDSFLAVFDRLSGRLLWRVDRGEFLRNYSTPVIWEVAGRRQIVIAATLRIVGYDLETGREAWTVNGVSRIVNMTPVIGPDNTLYAACWSPGGEGDDRATPLPIADLFAADADGNGTIELAEFPEHPFRRRFSQLDRDKNGRLSRAEYEAVSRAHSQGRNVLLAISPGGTGDITASHVRWEQTRQLPYCPSPLHYRDHLFLIKDGGILSVIDPATGKIRHQARLSATGNYYASPVAADGKIFLLSEAGQLTVLDAAQGWRELHTHAFEGDGHATPALVDGSLFLRVGETLYHFAGDAPEAGSNGR